MSPQTLPLTSAYFPRWQEKLLWAAGVGGLFLLIYANTNLISAGMQGVPSLYLAWEEQIPFIPWTIAPYMSLDLFFIVSFLLVKDRRELHGHIGRILMATTISCALFLIYPMQFAFSRPETAGWSGWLFNILALDLPYNQCPSLHVSLSLIYWPLIRRMTGPRGRILLGSWFWIIVLSTLTTYQHHFIDLMGGAILGLLVMYTIPLTESPRALINRQAMRIAFRYLAAAMLALGVAFDFQGWAWILLYPAISMSLIAAAYAAGRADFLQKRDGHHCPVIWLLFAPYLLATHLVWRHYQRRIEPWNHLQEGIYFGRKLTNDETGQLMKQGIHAILDLAPEVAEANRWGETAYCHLPMLDFATPDRKSIQTAVEFIKQHREGTYIHCSLGLFRSALVIVAFLESEGVQQADAMRQVQQIRPGIVIGDHATHANHQTKCTIHREEPSHA